MITSTSDDDPSKRGLAGRLDWVLVFGFALVLLVSLGGCGLEPEPITTTSGVTSPAGEVTIEILAPHSDYTNLVRISSPVMDLSLTNNDIGETENIQTKQGEEIVFEIQPLLSGSPVAGPWQSGPGSRNSDGKVHALVTSYENSACLMVSFEDEDAGDWGDHPSEPDYSDTVFWVYPTLSPPYDRSGCPHGPVSLPDE